MTHITTFIFDLGGVVLEWNPRRVYDRHFDSPEQVEAFLKEIDFANWNAQQDKGRPFAEGVAELSARYPHYADLIRLYHTDWELSVPGPIEGTVQIMRELKAAGYPLYALSNWSAETFPIARRKYDCLDLFNGIIISGEVRLVKPDPRIFEMTLQRLGKPAQECLLIDDAPANVTAAARQGFQVILFKSPQALRDEIVALGVLKSAKSTG